MSPIDPLIMKLSDGTTLKVDVNMELTINDQVPSEHEVVCFIIDFAKDSVKDPAEPGEALVDLVKKTTIEEMKNA